MLNMNPGFLQVSRKRKNLTFVGIHARRLGYIPAANTIDEESVSGKDISSKLFLECNIIFYHQFSKISETVFISLQPLLDADYYQDAMEYFREEYGEKETIFLLTSDDMLWARGSKELQEEKNLYFVGCGMTNDLNCVGQDFAFLTASNHTIISHGTFGQWAGYLAGGEMYTEHGALPPDSRSMA